MPNGPRLGRYTLLGKLATGGMAEVFLARQEGPEGFAKTVVVKRILPHLAQDENFVRMFLDEARLAARINHPNVVSIQELGRDADTGAYYMAMEFIDGCNLKRIVHEGARTDHRLPPELGARVIADACAGLDYAHNLKGEDRRPLNIVHRDISPENVIVTYTGLVKVVDFGIAKAASIEGHTQAGQVKGKFGYMPPEQLLSEPIDRRADVWALGVVLYWLCAGVKPFRGDNEAVIMQQILGSEPEPLDNVADVPPRLAEIVHKALAKDLNHRYESARALQQELEAWIAREGLLATAAALADYMNDRFPETTDRDRILVRALQTGEIQQATPSETDLLQPFKTAAPPAPTLSVQRRPPPPQGMRLRTLVGLAALTGAFGAMLGVGLYFFLQRAPPEPPAVAVETPLPPSPPPPVAAVAPIPNAVAPATPPPVPAPAAEPDPVQPPEAPPAPAPAPHPATVHKKGIAHHRTVESGTGSLAFRVSPWATVFVDGQRIGTTPLQPLDVGAGTHEVKLVNDPLHVERKVTVRVRPGETSLVKAILGGD